MGHFSSAQHPESLLLNKAITTRGCDLGLEAAVRSRRCFYNDVREITLSKSVHSDLHKIGIVPDTPNPR